MNRLLLFLILAIRLTDGSRAQEFRPGDLETIAAAEMRGAAIRVLPETVATAGGFDVHGYRCHWRIDPAVREIAGSVTVLFRVTGTAMDSLALDMAPELIADSVRYHGQEVPWNHAGQQLVVGFPSSIPPQTADSLTVYYHGVPPDQGFGSFVQSSHNGVPIIWTLSEPYGASDWWPCRNGLADKADSIDIFLDIPTGYRSASNGVLVSETPAGSRIIHHWKHRYPIAAYLVCLAVTNYAHYVHLVPFQGDTLIVDNFVYPEDPVTVPPETHVIIPMIQLFDTLFGIYPFQREKYGHAQFGWGGGMEHQTMTFVSSFGFELLAHELAHMWFGDKVTCGSWTDIWLNEGFATYLSGLCYEHILPDWWKRFREVRVKSVTAYPGGSVYCTDTTSVNRIFDSRLSYAKGALILHQLRWLMGDSAFFAALRNYLADPSLAYGFARTPQLKAHLESSCGCDLTGYFNDWYTGEGYPSYQTSWEQHGDTVTLTVGQTQSHPSVSFFEMDIPLTFKNETRDTILRFHHTFSGQAFTAVIPFTVDSVLFDPGYQLISANNTVSGILEKQEPAGVKVYPVPARDQVTFQFSPLLEKEAFRIRVFDCTGKQVAALFHPQNETFSKLVLEQFSTGQYSYLIENSELRVDGVFTIIR